MKEMAIRALEIWLAGGWAMPFLAFNAFLLCWLGFAMWLRLLEKEHRSLRESDYRLWIDYPEQRRGVTGRLIDFVMSAKNLREMDVYFQEFRHAETIPFERDLKVIKVCVAVSPLMGLLGTVTGMLNTFKALSLGSGGDKTLAMVSSGISEALITTETGLLIAIPGLLILHHLKTEHEKYEAFLAHVETVCSQALYRRLYPNAP
jgi:biopolymer transport protein ExbB